MAPGSHWSHNGAGLRSSVSVYSHHLNVFTVRRLSCTANVRRFPQSTLIIVFCFSNISLYSLFWCSCQTKPTTATAQQAHQFVPSQLCTSITPSLFHSRLKTSTNHFHQTLLIIPTRLTAWLSDCFSDSSYQWRFVLVASLIEFLFWYHAADYLSPSEHLLNTCISYCNVHITLTERRAANLPALEPHTRMKADVVKQSRIDEGQCQIWHSAQLDQTVNLWTLSALAFIS